ncbi:MAG: hypothetical protein WCF68_19575 [Terriglobales bacterium]
MADPVAEERSEKFKKSSRWWSGAVGTSLAGAAVAALRGCWHSNTSWPLCAQGYSYQVCLNCGAMRLFDEKVFRAYGPFRYDLEELIAWEKSIRQRFRPVADKRPALQAAQAPTGWFWLLYHSTVRRKPS